MVSCSGTCGTCYHFSCVGLNKSQYASWAAKVGMFWFCESCRLNFEPAVYDREKTIMKALRELLIRTDSMDTRLGNYGENLRTINRTLYGQQSKSMNTSLHQSTFAQSIDQLTLDEVPEDLINRSRSCNETSFFEVLDEVNSSIAHPTDKFIVGANKRVQILANPSSTSDNSTNNPRINVSTPAASLHKSTNPSNPVPDQANGLNVNDSSNRRPESTSGASRPSTIVLQVANSGTNSNDDESFYVTPFEPAQSEDEIKTFVGDISNAHPSLIKVTKLIPRGKNIADLSFVSFKVTVCKAHSTVVSDPWYWPEGVTVRPFELKPKNGFAIRLPNYQ